ncbi:MAG TPA: hypothetical protein PKA77_09610 [Chitinophagaceae bacterium]|jgi:hypothetical protein|nr:hypothetical protein [Chitinophagaceae bacterium]HMU58975.1 hypothetical protein [Chitinophagaceae bacterium]
MKPLLFLILFLPALATNAQTETQIRAHYQDINKKITESKEQGYEGSLYCNELVVNKNGKSWPATGTYSETTDFWYSEDPNHPENVKSKLLVLQKIDVVRKAAALTTSEEYLYLNGKLVFYFIQEVKGGVTMESRLYYNTKGLFKSSVKANSKELTAKELRSDEYAYFNPNPVGVLSSSKKYQELFVKSM